jgi:hypothetical protein
MTGPPSIRVRTFNQLLDELFFDSWRPEISRFRSNHAFRGMPRVGSSLATGLGRVTDPGLEGHLLPSQLGHATFGPSAGISN